MELNSIEMSTLDAMVVEQDLLEWLQDDEDVETYEEANVQAIAGHA